MPPLTKVTDGQSPAVGGLCQIYDDLLLDMYEDARIEEDHERSNAIGAELQLCGIEVCGGGGRPTMAPPRDGVARRAGRTVAARPALRTGSYSRSGPLPAARVPAATDRGSAPIWEANGSDTPRARRDRRMDHAYQCQCAIAGRRHASESLLTATSPALALSACRKNAHANCRSKTADGICVDLPRGNASVIDETAFANRD